MIAMIIRVEKRIFEAVGGYMWRLRSGKEGERGSLISGFVAGVLFAALVVKVLVR